MSALFRLVVLGALAPAALSAQSAVRLSVVRDLYVAPEIADLSLTVNMAVYPDGVIAVSQPLENTIRYFSGTGRAIRSIGRAGAGPGEFRYIGRLLWTADTLWVADMVLKRVTLLSAEQKVVKTVPLPTTVQFRRGGNGAVVSFSNLTPRARYAGGGMLFTALTWDRARTDWLPTGHRRGEYPILRTEPDGTVSRVIGFTVSSMDCEDGDVTIPLCSEPYGAYSADGSRVAFAAVVNGTVKTGEYRVTTLSEHGDTIFNRRYPFVPVPVSRTTRDSARALASKEAATPELRATVNRMHIPGFHPPLRNLVIGRDGTVWVEMRAVAGERRWQMLAPDGKPVGELALPLNVTLKVAQRDRIWAVIENEDGEQGIASYAIRGGK